MEQYIKIHDATNYDSNTKIGYYIVDRGNSAIKLMTIKEIKDLINSGCDVQGLSLVNNRLSVVRTENIAYRGIEIIFKIKEEINKLEHTESVKISNNIQFYNVNIKDEAPFKHISIEGFKVNIITNFIHYGNPVVVNVIVNNICKPTERCTSFIRCYIAFSDWIAQCQSFNTFSGDIDTNSKIKILCNEIVNKLYDIKNQK